MKDGQVAMVKKIHFRFSILIFVLISLIIVSPAFAEVKVFEQEVEEAVSRGQSQEQVEAFALQNRPVVPKGYVHNLHIQTGQPVSG